MLQPILEMPANPVTVICLCAAWCTTCGEYRARFAEVQARVADAVFHWVDIEDEADLLAPVEVEDFPTLLIAAGREPRFFGPLPPQPETLLRLVRAIDTLAAVEDAEVVSLAGRLLDTRRPG
jgi:hypothetical protein